MTMSVVKGRDADLVRAPEYGDESSGRKPISPAEWAPALMVSGERVAGGGRYLALSISTSGMESSASRVISSALWTMESMLV